MFVDFSLPFAYRQGKHYNYTCDILYSVCVFILNLCFTLSSIINSSLEPGTEQSMTGKDLEIEGYTVGGLSIGGHETCVIFPTLKVAFDIGRCPPRAVSQNFLLITHAHMDHIVSPFLSFMHNIQFLNCDWMIV